MSFKSRADALAPHVDWNYRNKFSRLVFAVSDLFSGVQPVRYSQILELDQKLSEVIVPSHLKVPPGGSSIDTDGPLLIMQRMIPVICGDGCELLHHSSVVIY